MDDYILITTCALIGTIIALAVIFIVPFGDDGTIIYDRALTTDRYITSDGQYHVKVIVDTSQCGTLMERWIGMAYRDMPSDKAFFDSTFQSGQFNIRYTCMKGQVTNIEAI